MKLNFNDQKDALLSQCVRKGSFLGICENDHKLLGHSSLVTPNFWPLPSQKNPVKHHRGGFCFTAFFCSQKKSCHLPNKNVVSGLHQRPPLLDPRKERKSKAWVEFVCLRIPLTIVFDASLNYVSRPPCPNGSLAWLPFHHYMHCSSKRILKKERPLRTWERKWERVPYLNSNVDLQTDDERQRKREQDQTFNSQPTVKLLQIIRP